uniref:Putative ubiquitin-associated protein 1 n=1 Tax=Rhipicephalus microplus TaxID=6941 RepID=A0A6M2CR60_RHIMP
MDSSRKDVACYLDGVQVKISEKFRPPRRIVLPMGLTRNFYPQTLQENYDFDLEQRTIEFAERYRKEQESKRQARTDRVAADIEQFTQSTAQDRSGACDVSPGSTNCVSATAVTAASVTSASILQPALAPETPGTTAPQSTTQKSFSLAEFENESSSPFDYVELQTINELEELSSVFQGMTTQSPQATSAEVERPVSEPTWPQVQPTETVVVKEGGTKATVHFSRSASDVCSSGNGSVGQSTKTPPPEPARQTELTPEETPQPLHNHQAAVKETPAETLAPLLRSLMDMGFDKHRAQRALHSQGSTDDKKVVEYLCQVQSLVDAGFSDVDAEEALQVSSGNYEQALEFLQLQRQFVALGFTKDSIVKALVKAQNDRDEALDLLLG